MSTLLYGHDGAPLLVSRPDGQVVQKNGAYGLSRAEIDRRYQEEVAKRVRARQTTVGTVDRMRGKPKPTPVSFETLRLMAARNEWIAAVVKTRKVQIAGVPWDITLKDTDDPSGAAARAAREVRKLLQRPMMHGSQPNTTTWRQWIGMILEDLLVLDAGAFEKERDGRKMILAMYPVDGATVRPNLDDRGAFQEDAYVQLVDGKIEARYGMEDLAYVVDNPQTDVRYYGYGFSPLEKLIVSVTADLHAARFNSSYFEKGAIPEGILTLGEDAAPEDVDAFRLYWMGEIVGKPWNLPIIGGTKAPEFIDWRMPNRDMQFMEYQDWLLQKICAVYQISKQELGAIEDVNRSTADSQDSSNERKGIQPLLALIKDVIDLEVVGEHGQGYGDYLEFTWEAPGEAAEAINAKYQPMVESGAATRQEWRDAHGLGEAPEGVMGAEGLKMHLATGQPQPLPSREDAQVMGASAQQDREDQMAQQERANTLQDGENDHQRQLEQAQAGKDDAGGQASAVPWKPADANDPATQRAMADHDRQAGIGPRNVRKAHPTGHDRHPALTRREDDLADVLDQAVVRLVDGLAQILGAAG